MDNSDVSTSLTRHLRAIALRGYSRPTQIRPYRVRRFLCHFHQQCLHDLLQVQRVFEA